MKARNVIVGVLLAGIVASLVFGGFNQASNRRREAQKHAAMQYHIHVLPIVNYGIEKLYYTDAYALSNNILTFTDGDSGMEMTLANQPYRICKQH